MQRDKRYLDRCKSQMQPMNKQSVLKVKKTFFFPIAPFISIVSPLQSQEREKGKPTFSVSLFFVRVLPLFDRRRRRNFQVGWGFHFFSLLLLFLCPCKAEENTKQAAETFYIAPPIRNYAAGHCKREKEGKKKVRAKAILGSK